LGWDQIGGLDAGVVGVVDETRERGDGAASVAEGVLCWLTPDCVCCVLVRVVAVAYVHCTSRLAS
jgi:hypothetical protein